MTLEKYFLHCLLCSDFCKNHILQGFKNNAIFALRYIFNLVAQSVQHRMTGNHHMAEKIQNIALWIQWISTP